MFAASQAEHQRLKELQQSVREANMERASGGCYRVDIGDEILPSYEEIIINHHKDPVGSL